VKSDRLRTKADPLKCDEPDRAQFMHITRTGATQNFSLGEGDGADSEDKFGVRLILKNYVIEITVQ